MKKFFYTVLFFIIGFTLVACNTKEETLVISKVISSNRAANNVIELYNNSDKDLKLSKYQIDIYDRGTDKVKFTIDLEGTVEANGYYVIGSETFNASAFEGVVELFDLKTEKTIPIRGSDAITLVKGKKVVDKLGYTDGIDINFNKNLSLIRLGNKEDYKASATYDRFNFINYIPNVFHYLKNDDHKIKTLEDLYNGPRLHDYYKDLPYASEDGQRGTGGAPIATLVGIADGDTATFSFDEKPEGTTSHRYYYIDTAEKAGPNTSDEPWGHIGTKYNTDFLLNDAANKELRVQSIPNTGLFDTYSRNLGLIWINGQLSQHLIVQEGLSKVDDLFGDVDFELYYEDVPYLTFLVFAQERARMNGWGMHGYPTNPLGEKAPDWDYNSNKKAPASDYANWTPHIPISW